MRHTFATIALTLFTLLSAATQPGCSASPATGRMQFIPPGFDEQEVSIGAQAAPDFIQAYGGEVPSPEVRQHVSALGQRLAAESERSDLPWEFHVLNSPVINAFAIPGGQVFITRGLLEKMNNEAQLAGVLGHEIGHVTDRHIGQQMGQQLGVQVLGAGLGIAGQVTEKEWLQYLGAGTQVGGGLYLLKFGRDQESTADELGLRYMTELGYNPLAMIQVMDILNGASGEGGGSPEWLSTHPAPETRIRRIEKEIKDDYPGSLETGTYRFGEKEFEREVLAPLKRLPPAPRPKAQG